MPTGNLATLRQTIAARIAATSTTAFRQGTSTAWKQERHPFAILDASHARKHLTFSANVDSANVTDRGAGSSSANPWQIEASVRVLFSYRIRASRRADLDLSSTAAEAVAASILSLDTEDATYRILPDLIYSPTLTDDGETVLIEQRYLIRFDSTI